MSLPDRLQRIVEDVRARTEIRRAGKTIDDLRDAVISDPGRRARFTKALRAPGLSLIAECKRSSPSAGTISVEVDLAPRIEAYARGGAAALSILTEPDHFGGDLSDLRAAPEVRLPRLRKDFLLDLGAVFESALAGADAILLIVRCLEGESLAELRKAAGECGLGVLLEVHDRAELERAIAVEPDALGVNARDLVSFETDLALVEELLPLVPSQLIRVAESGLHSSFDLRRVQAAGADAALVGSALMQSSDPAATLASWRSALDVD